MSGWLNLHRDILDVFAEASRARRHVLTFGDLRFGGLRYERAPGARCGDQTLTRLRRKAASQSEMRAFFATAACLRCGGAFEMRRHARGNLKYCAACKVVVRVAQMRMARAAYRARVRGAAR